ncbi:MAG: tetratricopeptide repeat protein [Fibromonadales bacterium]|nr:tetratricopeptide repeat protein [Fibromonadales bacterium]
MANPLSIFFSRLAPEDKQFVKKIGISLIVLLIISAGAWYAFAYLEKEHIDPTGLIEKIVPNEEAKDDPDTIAMNFDLPAAPEVPEHEEYQVEETLEEIVAPTPSVSLGDDFDVQAHLQLMRQNVSKYNYTLAYKHGARIVSSLLADPKLTAEWGSILLEAGRYGEAISALQRIVSQDTVKTDVAINMALSMFRSGNADGAIEFLDEKMQSNNDLDLLATKASIIGEHPDAKRRPAAEQHFLKCVKSKDASPIANYGYGRYLMSKGDYGNSKIYLERALKVKPREPRYIARLGMAEFYLKQDAKAEALYKQALEINPYDYNTWFNLGELYLSLANETSSAGVFRQKMHKALESYLKTIDQDSLHIRANYRIGLVLNWNGQHKEAIKHLGIALEKMPQEIPIMQQLSSAYMKLGDTAKSVDYLDAILKIDPFNKIAATEMNRVREQR